MPPQNFASILKEQQAAFGLGEVILVTAPAPRCGVTLLQRMLNAGGESIIFGENFYLCFELPQRLMRFEPTFLPKAKKIQQTQQEFFSGRKSMDATALLPPHDEYMTEMVRSFYRLADVYKNYSTKNGAKLWGMKCPMVGRRQIRPLMRFLPELKIIAIRRNLLDVARSNYTRWPENYQRPETFKGFAFDFSYNDDVLWNLPKSNVLNLRYEELLASPESSAEAIETHCGVHVSRSELGVRVNIQDTSLRVARAQTTAGGFYLPPRDLPQDAQKWLAEGVEAFSRRRDINVSSTSHAGAK